MIKIGLTGGIATGKTTVARIMEQKGAIIVDTDILAHNAYIPDTLLWQQIVKEFGEDILTPAREIDRKILGKIVFNDIKKREKLNSIVHPYVIEQTKKNISYWQNMEQKNKKKYLVVIVIPLLFETRTDYMVDCIVVVRCKKETQLSRLMERNKLTQEEALKRINAQMDMEEKVARANYVIDNDEDLNLLENQVEKILQKWQ